MVFCGAALPAANQCEGGYAEGGKGPGVVDTIPWGPQRMAVMKGELDPADLPADAYYPSHEAIDMYHHWREDFKLFAELGFKCYRFSISWSRIFPQGIEEEPNEAGLRFYEEMIDTLLGYGIEPMVTLCHFDQPTHLLALHEGWRSRKNIDAFLRYCEGGVHPLQGQGALLADLQRDQYADAPALRRGRHPGKTRRKPGQGSLPGSPP